MTITHRNKFVALTAGAALAAALIVGAFAAAVPAQAQSALTQTQINAIVSLLQSFGADASVIANVQVALGGGTPSGGSTGGSASACYSWTRDLAMGSTGADVMALQQFLNGNGAVVASAGAGSPGNESMYFGALTKAALAKWQAANGVSPAAGYFGPITRAAIAAKCAAAPGTPGTPGSSGLQGTAGSVSVTSTATEVEDKVLTGQTEMVLGFKVEASGSDVRVTNVRVKFTAAVDSTASDRLSNYAKEISIYADGQKVGSMSPSAFTRDSAGVYSASIPVNQIVRMGSGNRVIFHVGFTANDSIDSDDAGSTNDWTAEFVQLRYVDATGAVLTDSTGGITNAGIYVDRVSSSSEVKLRMGEGANNPKAGNVQVSESNTTEITLLEFTLKAEGADMYFDQIKASTTVTGATNVSNIASDFYLMRGSSKLAEVAGGSGTAQNLVFNLDSTENLSQGDTVTYKIVAKIKSIGTGSGSGTAFDQGDTIQASTSNVTWKINAKATVDGKSVTERTGSVTDYTQRLYSKGIQVAKLSDSVTVSNNGTTPANSFGTFKMTVRVTVFGSDDVYIPLNAGATTTSNFHNEGMAYKIVRSDGTATTSGASATVTRITGGTLVAGSPDLVKISGGQTADIELNVSFNPGPETTLVNTLKQWRLELASVGHRANSSATVATSNVTMSPAEDYRSSFSAAIDN